jgi:hypothetical protein
MFLFFIVFIIILIAKLDTVLWTYIITLIFYLMIIYNFKILYEQINANLSFSISVPYRYLDKQNYEKNLKNTTQTTK